MINKLLSEAQEKDKENKKKYEEEIRKFKEEQKENTKIKIRVAVASVASVVAGVATFFVTRHPYLAFEAGKATLCGIGGAAVGGLIGTGGTVAVEKITEEDKD